MMKEEQFTEQVWDKKKIIIFFIVILTLVGFLIFFKNKVLSSNLKIPFLGLDKNSKSVEGTSTTNDQNQSIADSLDNDSSLPITSAKKLQTEVYERVENIKKEISSLSFTEVASSSPQVQKILKDIQNLENLPKNQAKEACQKICSSF